MSAVVHVRWAEPDPADAATAWLDRTERSRVSRLTRAEDQARFVTSRSLLKALVGSLMGLPAADVALSYECSECGEPHGRPVLVGPADDGDWAVGLSHAGARVLVAASHESAVGVDVETVAAVGFSGFGDVALAPAELRAAAALPAADRQPAMARAWVRKEALLKARGIGLRVDPREADTTSLEPGWSVIDLDVGAGYVAAVAVSGSASVQLGTHRGRPARMTDRDPSAFVPRRR